MFLYYFISSFPKTFHLSFSFTILYIKKKCQFYGSFRLVESFPKLIFMLLDCTRYLSNQMKTDY